jgi:mannose-6-phosphate isomerase
LNGPDLYPLPLSSRRVTALWGNPDWTALFGPAGRQAEPLGELWLNDDRPGGSRVIAGPWAGRELGELLQARTEEFLGPTWTGLGRSPLLLKFLNPGLWLSLQVHPDGPIGRGKTEAWHILAARPGAELIAGLRPGLSQADLARAAAQGGLADLVHRCPVRAGQTYFVPAGLLHSLGPGLLLFEIQQNSDVTFRLSDWGRLGPDGRPRPLHLDQALAAIDFTLGPAEPVAPRMIDASPGRRQRLAACPHFVLDRLELAAPLAGQTQRLSFLTGLSGRGWVKGGGQAVEVRPGATILLPAGLGGYEVLPEPNQALILLESWAPDLDGA